MQSPSMVSVPAGGNSEDLNTFVKTKLTQADKQLGLLGKSLDSYTRAQMRQYKKAHRLSTVLHLMSKHEEDERLGKMLVG
jgi:hypothetical protein